MKIQSCHIENIKLILNPFNSLFFKAFRVEFLYLTSFSLNYSRKCFHKFDSTGTKCSINNEHPAKPDSSFLQKLNEVSFNQLHLKC